MSRRQDQGVQRLSTVVTTSEFPVADHVHSHTEDSPGIDIKGLAPIWATVFSGMFWITAVRPFASEIASALGTSVAVVGQFTALSMLTMAFAGLFSGPIADHIGHRRSLVIGLGLLAVAAATLALSINIVMLLLAGITGGLGGSMTYGVALGIVANRYTGYERRKALGSTQAFASTATILSPLLLTAIAAWTVWRGAHLFLMLVIFVAMALVVRLLPRSGNTSTAPLSPTVILKAYRPLWNSRPAMTLYVASAIRAMLTMGVTAYIGAYYVDHYGMSLREVGLASMVEGIGLVAGSFIGGSYLNGFSQRPLFAGATLAIGLSWLLTFVVAPPALVTIVIVVTATMLIGMTMTMLTSLIAEESPCGAATTMVLNISAIGLGAAVGAAYGGLVISLGGYTALGVGALPFAMVSAFLVWRPPSIQPRSTLDPDAATFSDGHPS